MNSEDLVKTANEIKDLEFRIQGFLSGMVQDVRSSDDEFIRSGIVAMAALGCAVKMLADRRSLVGVKITDDVVNKIRIEFGSYIEKSIDSSIVLGTITKALSSDDPASSLRGDIAKMRKAIFERYPDLVPSEDREKYRVTGREFDRAKVKPWKSLTAEQVGVLNEAMSHCERFVENSDDVLFGYKGKDLLLVLSGAVGRDTAGEETYWVTDFDYKHGGVRKFMRLDKIITVEVKS